MTLHTLKNTQRFLSAMLAATFLLSTGTGLVWADPVDGMSSPNTPNSPTAALQFPKDLIGTWQGSDGKTYEIQAVGNQITLLSPKKKGGTMPYRGEFLRNGFKINFQAKAPGDITDLPDKVIRQLLARGYTFRGEITPKPDGTIELIFISDDVTYDRWEQKVSGVTMDAGQDNITLRREQKYKIGSIQQKEDGWQRRTTVEKAKVNDDIQRIKSIYLPVPQANVESRLRQVAQEKERIASYQAKLAEANGRIETALGQLREIQTQLSQNPDWQRKVTLERAIDRLTDQVLEAHQAGHPENAREQLKSIEDGQAQLKQLEPKIKAELKKYSQLDRIQKDIDTALIDVRLYGKMVDDLLTEHQKTGDTLALEKKRLETLEEEVRMRERFMTTLEQKPQVVRVTVTQGGNPIYDAHMDQDGSLLKEFAETIDLINREIARTSEEMKQIAPEIAVADAARAPIHAELKEAREALNVANDALVRQINANAYKRYFTELIGNSVDVVMAFRQGGIAGCVGELGQKLYEQFAVGDGLEGGFKTFDESALKKQYYGEEAETSSDVAGFAESQALKMPFTMVKEGAMQLLEHGDLQKQGTEVIEDLARRRGANEISGELNSAVGRLVRSRESLDIAERAYTSTAGQVGRQAERSMLVEAQKLNKAAIEKLIEAQRKELIESQAIKQGNKKLREISNKISEMRSSGGALKSLGAGVATGLLVDGLKAALQSRFDRQEEALWMRYFEADIRINAILKSLKTASNHYWNIVDNHEKLMFHRESMAILREQTEKDRQDYLSSVEKTGGLFVKTNNVFEPNQPPIQMQVVMVGPTGGERLRLLSANQSSALAVMPMQPFQVPTIARFEPPSTTTPASATASSPGKPGIVGAAGVTPAAPLNSSSAADRPIPARLDTQMHQFIIPNPAEIKVMSPTPGDLPLEIEKL